MGMTSGLIYEKMSLRKDMDPHDYEITGMYPKPSASNTKFSSKLPASF